ncbi:MAG: DPP IV N-terminal domain-containing protein [Bacteroidales bacterium]|jgi:Tol biopolymer transport system component|nr:DPP IV N-terminal domain-containing protein [Bacteroidales bacterium]MDD4672847.1 DPP IV N-terminal domain-containing protein [Bacteroidales bacterium]MDY0349205.1 DPP IV N-terminal domain-containing protein [Tenuifilaceae bacterium]
MDRKILYSIAFALLFANYACERKENPSPEEPFDFSTIDSEPAWSPDGQWIAFVHSSMPNHGIYLISPDGEEIHLWHQGIASSPAWSPCEQWIAFSQNAQIWKKKINGDSLTQLTFEGRNFFPAWSKCGSYIAHVQSVCNYIQCGLWLINLSEESNTPIVEYGTVPDFHPLTPKVLYKKSWIEAGGQHIGDSLYFYNLETGKTTYITRLSHHNYDNRYFKISPSGDKIAFTSQSEITGAIRIWSMNIDGSQLTQLTNSQSYSNAWSPCGSYIVYTDARSESGRFWIMNADGSNKRQLTFEHHF